MCQHGKHVQSSKLAPRNPEETTYSQNKIIAKSITTLFSNYRQIVPWYYRLTSTLINMHTDVIKALH